VGKQRATASNSTCAAPVQAPSPIQRLANGKAGDDAARQRSQRPPRVTRRCSHIPATIPAPLRIQNGSTYIQTGQGRRLPAANKVLANKSPSRLRRGGGGGTTRFSRKWGQRPTSISRGEAPSRIAHCTAYEQARKGRHGGHKHQRLNPHTTSTECPQRLTLASAIVPFYPRGATRVRVRVCACEVCVCLLPLLYGYRDCGVMWVYKEQGGLWCMVPPTCVWVLRMHLYEK
jgi:hypothetical protein